MCFFFGEMPVFILWMFFNWIVIYLFILITEVLYFLVMCVLNITCSLWPAFSPLSWYTLRSRSSKLYVAKCIHLLPVCICILKTSFYTTILTYSSLLSSNVFSFAYSISVFLYQELFFLIMWILIHFLPKDKNRNVLKTSSLPQTICSTIPAYIKYPYLIYWCYIVQSNQCFNLSVTIQIPHYLIHYSSVMNFDT